MQIFLKNGMLVVAAFVFSLVVIEIVLRIYNPFIFTVAGDKVILPENRRYEIVLKGVPKLEEKILHTKNSIGMRGEEPPENFADALTLVTIGGSTTESFYITDGKPWPRRLEARLRAHAPKTWLGNAGYSGHSTYGHIFLMEQFVSMLRPDVAIFLIGINELGLTSQRSFDKSLNRAALNFDNFKSGIRSLLLKSEVAVLGLNLYRRFKASRLNFTKTQTDFVTVRRVEPDANKSKRIIAEHLEEYVRAYEARLRTLTKLTVDAGIMPILVTQPLVYGPDKDPTTGLWLGDVASAQHDGITLWRVLELYNDTTRRIAAEKNILLVDLGHLFPKDSKYYYDHVHFTVLGSDLVAKIIFPAICKAVQEKFPTQFVKSCSNCRTNTIHRQSSKIGKRQHVRTTYS